MSIRAGRDDDWQGGRGMLEPLLSLHQGTTLVHESEIKDLKRRFERAEIMLRVDRSSSFSWRFV